jgi:uncharacterized protein (TIGR02246 family)
MNRVASFLALCVLAATASAAWGGAKEEVASATEEWATQFSADTPDPLLALYDKEAIVWGTRSKTLSPDQAAIREYFATAFRVLPERKVSFGEQRIRVYGDTAINTGYCTFLLVNREGKATTAPARYSLVYVRRDGKWLIVDHHSSPMPAP